jgi:hypothetical protein
MIAQGLEEAIQTIQIEKDILIEAPLDIVWESVLAEVGPECQMPDGTPMPFVLEGWPGGRWFRDLGENRGHLWGHVQVIKPPALLELCGPMFMSYPATNHIQYRLMAESDRTRLRLLHRALGLIPADVRGNASTGWEYGLKRIREIAEGLVTKRKKENQK